jgi:hypothetical protein
MLFDSKSLQTIEIDKVNTTDLSSTRFNVFNEVLKNSGQENEMVAGKTRLPSACDTDNYCLQAPSELGMRYF